MLYQDLAGELWFRTQGYFQDVKQLICDATIAATNDGTHMILRDHLDAVTLSDRAEAERHETTTREARKGVKEITASEAGTAAKSPAAKAITPSSKRSSARRSRSARHLVEDQRP